MIRKSALVVGVLLSSITAGRLLAQTAAPAKPAPASSMQHAPSATPAKPMQQDTASASSAAKVHHAAWTKDQIKEAQEGLVKAGFFKGQPNGVLGKKTRKAIREYQKANKLPVTGRLNEDLLTRLHSA